MPEIDNAHDELEQHDGEEPEAAPASDEAAAPINDEINDEPAADPEESSAEAFSAEGEPVEGEPAEGLPDEELPVDTMHWYIIHTYSGFERKVAESLKTRADAFGFAEQIGQILIPEEEVVELRNGKKVTSKRLLYPGYVVVQMEMNDELWHRVKDTPRVTGFVGGGQTPIPLSADEINKMLYRQTTAAERPRPKMTFEKGEAVRIIDGPFANFQGKVDEINPERNTLRVLVTIFGRATPVELDFLQVEKTA
jgi:transcriptional antiterminator NusG